MSDRDNDAPGERERERDHAVRQAPRMAWLLILLALPAFYLFSAAPIYRFSGTVFKATPTGSAPSMEIYMVPRWVSSYCLPYFWLWSQTPLREPLQAYMKLWGVKRIGTRAL